jgi:hypothetical protein
MDMDLIENDQQMAMNMTSGYDTDTRGPTLPDKV